MKLPWRREGRVGELEAEVEALLAAGNSALDSGSADDLERSSRRLLAAYQELVPRLAEPVVAGALFDLTRLGVVTESRRGQWTTGMTSASLLTAAVLRLSGIAEERGEPRLPSGFQQRLRGLVDEAFYMCHRSANPSGAARFGEGLIGASFTTRQLIETIPADQLAALRPWGARVAGVFPKVSLLDTEGISSREEIESRSWAAMVEGASIALTLPPDEQLVFAMSSQCTTLVAAASAERDVVYLAAGSRGGAAIRFFGGDQANRPPVSIELPTFDVETARELRQKSSGIFAAAAVRRGAEVAADLQILLFQIGEKVIAPIAAAWPDMTRVSVIPVGEAQGLPLPNGLLAEGPWSNSVDVTVSPNAQSLLLATMQPRPGSADPVVLGEPGPSGAYLKWVEPELTAIRSLYAGRAASTPSAPADAESDFRDLRQLDSAVFAEILLQQERTPHAQIDAISKGSIVHLACHGYVPDSASEEAMLFLQGRLPVSDFFARRLRPGVSIVLSACSVGAPVEEEPLEVLGFPAVLLSIGARQVLASLWPVVDSPQTVAFMQYVHVSFVRRGSLSLALADATKNAIATDVPATVWGGFTTFGT